MYRTTNLNSLIYLSIGIGLWLIVLTTWKRAPLRDNFHSRSQNYFLLSPIPSSSNSCTLEPKSPYDLKEHRQTWIRHRNFVKNNNLTFLHSQDLLLHRAIMEFIELNNVSGAIAEFGVAKGGSAILLCAMKRAERCLHLFDTFDGLPPPSQKDGEDAHRRYEQIISGKAGENYYG